MAWTAEKVERVANALIILWLWNVARDARLELPEASEAAKEELVEALKAELESI
jgi:hypothetical protein